MPCTRIKIGSDTGIVCTMGWKTYKFGKWKFEFSPFFGPQPLRKDGRPYANIPSRFWGAFNDWIQREDREEFQCEP